MKETIYRNTGFQEVIDHVLRNFYINEEKNVISFFEHYARDSQKIVTNIVHVDVQSRKQEIQSRIDKLNEVYFQITNIKDHLLNNNYFLNIQRR